MSIKIYSTKDVFSNGIKCCIYGKSGIGKTSLLATLPRSIVLSCEGGLLSLRKNDIPYIKIKELDDMYEAYDFLTSRKGRRYKNVGLDSISEIAEVVLAGYKKKEKNLMRAYGKIADEMEELIRMFRDLDGRNVVFTAKRGRMVDPDTGLTQYFPSMPGKVLPEGLPYFFDEVFYYTKIEAKEGKKERALITEGDLEWEAKDRSGSLNRYERPDLRRIFRKISEDK